jgi:RHS repeat-associated protein
MKREVILLILLISVPISYAKVIDVSEVSDSEQIRDGQGVKKYVYAGSSIIASIEGSEIKYYHKDRLSNRLTTNENGNKDDEFKSLPFGQKVSNSGVDYPFTGKEEDESSLYYFGARYYDDNLGRFVSVDPITSEPAYQYVSNNPMNYIDPSGMNAEDEEKYSPDRNSPFPYGLDHAKTMALGYQLGGAVMKEILYAFGVSERWANGIGTGFGVGFGYGVEHWNENSNEKSDPDSDDTRWDLKLGYIGLAQSLLRDFSILKTDLVVYNQLGTPRPGGPEEIWEKLGFVPIQQKAQAMLIFGEGGKSTLRPYLTYSVDKPDAEYEGDSRVAGITSFSLGFLENGVGVGYSLGIGDAGTHSAGMGMTYERIFRHGNSFSFPFSVSLDAQKGFQSRGFFSGWEAQLRPSIGVQYQFVP